MENRKRAHIANPQILNFLNSASLVTQNLIKAEREHTA